jgi:hypothetical protein
MVLSFDTSRSSGVNLKNILIRLLSTSGGLVGLNILDFISVFLRSKNIFSIQTTLFESLTQASISPLKVKDLIHKAFSLPRDFRFAYVFAMLQASSRLLPDMPPHKPTSIRYPVSGIRYLASSNQYPVSSTQHSASDIQYQASSIQHSVSGIRNPASCILTGLLLPEEHCR